MNFNSRKNSVKWTVVGVAFGAAASWTTQFCLCAYPALPGIIIAIAFGADQSSIMTCAGGDWLIMLPANMAFYGLGGYGLGVFLDLRDKRKNLADHSCTLCSYSLIGNTSGRCPECGTPISSDSMKKIADLKSSKPHNG